MSWHANPEFGEQIKNAACRVDKDREEKDEKKKEGTLSLIYQAGISCSDFPSPHDSSSSYFQSPSLFIPVNNLSPLRSDSIQYGLLVEETVEARPGAACFRYVSWLFRNSETIEPRCSCTLTPGADKAVNLTHARSKVLEAAQAGAKLIVLPECFNSPYGTQYFPKYAETLLPSPPTKEQSPSYHALSSIAAEAKAYLVGGSIPELEPTTNKFYNTALVFSPTGALIGTHRKVHLFDIDIPGKIAFKESEVLSPGNQLTMVELPEYGKIGLSICYDIRFPESAMIAARKDAFMLVYPGAFNMTTGPMHWSLLARARAVDNQVYVALCSPARDMSATYHAYGHSLVTNPTAEILAEAEEKEDIVYADLDNETIQNTRKSIPVYTQRRFDLYPDVSMSAAPSLRRRET